MFDNLSQGLEKAWDIVRKDGKLTPENIKAPMREIRRSLLEADVRTACLHPAAHAARPWHAAARHAHLCTINTGHSRLQSSRSGCHRSRCAARPQVSLPTVRKFVAGLEQKALGAKVVKGAKPEQQLVKIVNDELVALMGGKQAELVVPKDGPQVRCVPGCSMAHRLPDRVQACQQRGVGFLRRAHQCAASCPSASGLARCPEPPGRADHPDGGPPGRGQDHAVRQAGAAPHQGKQEGARVLLQSQPASAPLGELGG